MPLSRMIPADGNVSALTRKLERTLSVNTQLANEYKEYQGLAPVQRGTPTLRADPNAPSTKVEYVPIQLDNSSNYSPRDRVTGRILAQNGRSCLRCMDKNLRCTLNFVGQENKQQCAACRRSKDVRYCVRYEPPQDKELELLFNGPPWKNPYFVAGTAESEKIGPIPPEELERLLHDFHDGKSVYVMGNYVPQRDVLKFALPPFNGADLSPTHRPKKKAIVDHKDVLPDWRNRSLKSSLGKENFGDDEREKEKVNLALARRSAMMPKSPAVGGPDEEGRQNLVMIPLGGSGNDQIDLVSLLRVSRKYEPREKNLVDHVLGETW
ncbi:hypothetical protein F4808DRAFT_470355 [Astrocystis sublimbata]|nr:hypothetical protein F4808DRAFT_470355 [Astrocystis sublimbata]